MVCGAWVSVLAAVLHQPKAANAMCGPVGPGIELRSLLQSLGGRQLGMCCRCITANGQQTALAAKPADEAGELLAHGVLLSRRAGTERTSSAAWSPADWKYGRSDAHRIFSDAPLLLRVCERANKLPHKGGPKKQVLAKARCKERVGR